MYRATRRTCAPNRRGDPGSFGSGHALGPRWNHDLRNFLKPLEVRIPPASGHHSLTYAWYGNEDNGWDDRLLLTVRAEHKGEEGVPLFLEDGDLEKPRELLFLAGQE